MTDIGKFKGTLHFLIGKMGAGKSTFSKKLAEDSGYILISEDDWLARLYPDEINSFDDYINRHCRLLSLLAVHVKHILNAGNSVILDFPGNTAETRAWFKAVAHSANAPLVAHYIKASDEKCLAQIKIRRVEQPKRAKFDTPEVFQQVNSFFEEPTEAEGLFINLVE